MPRLRRSSLAEAYYKASYDLTSFKYLIDRRYVHAPHLELLDQHLTEVTRYIETGGKEGIGRLIVEMPPRHGKTTTVTQKYPVWHLGRNPDHRVMMVSYGADLVEKSSRAARNYISTEYFRGVFPDLYLDPSSRSANSWNLDRHAGGVDAIGMTGGATGKGAHLLIVDDPIKNRAEAESQTYRERIWDGFRDDLYTRLEPGGAIIIIMTRWHEDDLVGRVLKYMPGEWVRLRLPAFAEPDDPLGRHEGAALWPWRFDQDALKDIERKLGPYSFAALYQQTPQPGSGGLFKLDSFTPLRQEAPPLLRRVRYWDLAMSDKTSADYTAGVLYGLDGDAHRYVLDVARGQIDWGDLTEWLAEVMLADGPEVMQGIEEKGYMSRAITELNADPRFHGFRIFGYPKENDKWTNALPVAAKAAAGFVHVLDRHWTPDFLDEVCAFNKAAHDDQVDALAGAEVMIGIGDAAYAGVMYDGQNGYHSGPY